MMGRKSGRKRGIAIPDDWEPSSAAFALAAEKWRRGREWVQAEADRFRNWALAKDARYSRWDAAFRNWLAKAVEFEQQRGKPPGQLEHERHKAQPALLPGQFAQPRLTADMDPIERIVAAAPRLAPAERQDFEGWLRRQSSYGSGDDLERWQQARRTA